MTSSFYRDKIVLVTGGTGFVGSALVSRLVLLGARVSIVTRSGTAERWGNTVRAIACDVADREAVRKTLETIKPSVVFHCAASVKPQADIDTLIRSNLIGTQSLLDACIAIRPEAIVAAGSWTECGPPVRDNVREDDPAVPASLYGITKLAATLATRAWSIQTGIPATVLRLGAVYGPGEEAYRLIPTLVTSAHNGTPATLGSPDPVRDFIHLDDVVEAFLAAGERGREPGVILNIASGAGTSVGDLVALFQEIAPSFPSPVWGKNTPRPWDIPRWVADTSRARVALGWQPVKDLRTGLRELLEYAP